MGKKKIEISGQLTLWDLMAQPFRIRKPVRLIELFGGIGSQAMAFKELGVPFEHYRLVEFDKYPVASYNAIHGTNFEPVDIRQMHGADLGIVEPWNYTYFLTYSFPCQDLSVAGKGAGMAKGSGTRSGLLWEVERLLNETEILPQVLLMENVPQVHGKKNMPDFQKWLDFLSGKGYQNFWQDLNAKDFGVAQNRSRCFCVSILGGGNFSFPEIIPLTKVMSDYLDDEVDDKYYIKSEKIERLVPRLIKNGKMGSCIGNINPSGSGINGNVYAGELAPTITTNKGEGVKICVLGNIYGFDGNKYSGNVYSQNALSPAIRTYQGGNQQPLVVDAFSTNGTDVSGTIRASYYKNGERNMMENLNSGKGYEGVIVAMRGRNPENPSDRTAGIPTEQRFEVNGQGICNCLTSVQKDNLVMETLYDFYNQKMREDSLCGTITANGNTSSTHCGTFGVIQINQATKKGYVECEIGGIADLSFPGSMTRNGRVLDGGKVCPNITAGNAETGGLCRIEGGSMDSYTFVYEDGKYIYYIRIRKMIPLECWRLMGFSDEDFLRAEAVSSNTQLYKQAGNSIVKNVLVAIIGQMFEGCEDIYKNR